MKTSELIEKLQESIRRHGDLDVFLENWDEDIDISVVFGVMHFDGRLWIEHAPVASSYLCGPHGQPWRAPRFARIRGELEEE